MMHSMLAAMFTEYRKRGEQMSMFDLQMATWDLIRLVCLGLLLRKDHKAAK